MLLDRLSAVGRFDLGKLPELSLWSAEFAAHGSYSTFDRFGALEPAVRMNAIIHGGPSCPSEVFPWHDRINLFGVNHPVVLDEGNPVELLVAKDCQHSFAHRHISHTAIVPGNAAFVKCEFKVDSRFER